MTQLASSSETGSQFTFEEAPSLKACLLAGVLCNDTQLVERDHEWRIVGDPTEGALLVAARKSGIDLQQSSEQCPRIDVIPFESQRQFMATLHQRTDHSSNIVFVKGAMEKVLSMCAQELDPEGRERPCDPDPNQPACTRPG